MGFGGNGSTSGQKVSSDLVNQMLGNTANNPAVDNMKGLNRQTSASQQPIQQQMQQPAQPMPQSIPHPMQQMQQPMQQPIQQQIQQPIQQPVMQQQPVQMQNQQTVLKQDNTVYENAGSVQQPNTVEGVNKKVIVIACAVIAFLGVGMLALKMVGGKGNKQQISNSQNTQTDIIQQSESIIPEPEYGQAVMPDGSMMVVEIRDGEPVIPLKEYTEEEKQQLRSVGFTGTDIEEMQKAWKDPKQEYETNLEKLNQFVDDLITQRSNTSSTAYKKLRDQTHLGEKRAIVKYGENQYDPTTVEKNVDYEKLEATYRQLPVKLYINDDNEQDYIIWYTDADTYYNMRQTGNIVVKLTYEDAGLGAYQVITNIEKVR